MVVGNADTVIAGDGDSGIKSIANDISALEVKLLSIHLSDPIDDTGKCKQPGGQALSSVSTQTDLRNWLKSIASFLQQNDDALSPVELSKLQTLLLSLLTLCQDSENDISSILSYIKLLSEIYPATPVSTPVSTTEDIFWEKLLGPITPAILDFLNVKVFRKCLEVFSASSSPSCLTNESINEKKSTPGSGFAFHQQLGILLKGVRNLLVYLKRGTSYHELPSRDKSLDLNPQIFKTFQLLCALLNPVENTFYKQENNFDVGLDIRCNIGVGICYSLDYLEDDKTFLRNLYQKIYHKDIALPPASTKIQMEMEKEILTLAHLEINRIALGYAILSTWLEHRHDVDLYLDIGQNILDIQHGVKEAVNLGSARVLEIWANNLARPCTPSILLHSVSKLLPTLEFFCFMYMPGHIDAVKNCCRNIISGLALIYDRFDEEKFPSQGTSSWIASFLRRILEKPSHIKWLTLANVCRNSKKSLEILKTEPNMPIKFLNSDKVFKLAVGEAYVALMSYHFEVTTVSDWEETWIEPLFASQHSLNKESNWTLKRIIISTILNSEKLRLAQIQPMIRPLLQNVLSRMNSTNSSSTSSVEAALLAVETIKMAHELKISVDSSKLNLQGETPKDKDSFKGLVPRSVLHQWLWSSSLQIRLAGMALLVETKKTSEEVSVEDFHSLKIFLKYNLLSQNPGFRQQLVSYFKKFVRRLKNSLACIRRRKDTQTMELYENFIRWLWIFLTEEEGLFHGANFGRRCQALECLSELTQTFQDFQVYSVGDTGNLKYLRWLKDSYENNKIEAMEILVRMPIKEFQDPLSQQEIFNEALSLCKSIKPPDSMTGRYLMTLLMRKCEAKSGEKYSAFNILESLYSELEGMYEKIKTTSLIQVSAETPLYGCVRCIRMILQNTSEYKSVEGSVKYRAYVEKLLKLCFDIDSVLFPVLGNAAPEGFIPGLKDSNPEEKQVVRSLAAQMLLVCAWRTMKENCLLASDMCSLFLIEGEPSPLYILTFLQVSQIGDHLLHLLMNLMHRGVFEQVYVGFKQLATRLWKSPSGALSRLPEKWLMDAMDQEHISAKSITRRSAGLPFIFQALLSAESANEQFLQKWVQRLLVFDEKPEMAPIRIHSMNVLRGLFRDASFSSPMMPFVPHGLRMAFRGLKSPDWGERNSGLMLYGAVMRRTFGPKLNLMNATTFFRKFPQMYDFLLEELRTCVKLMERRKKDLQGSPIKTGGEVPFDFTFHLLLLLSSFTPSGRVEDTHFKLAAFLPTIRKCGENDDMEVRKLSAKAIVPFLTSPEDKLELATNILKELDSGKTTLSQNHLHGLLAQLLAVISSLPRDESTDSVAARSSIASDFLKFVSSLSLPSNGIKFKAPSVFETMVDIILALKEMKCVSPSELKNGLDIVTKQFEKYYGSTSIPKHMIPGLAVAERKFANAVIQIGEECLSRERNAERIYGYFTDSSSKSKPYVEQYLELFDEENDENIDKPSISRKKIDLEHLDETLVETEAIIGNYLERASQEFTKFPGTEFELKYLRFMKHVPSQIYELIEPSMVSKLINRLLEICQSGEKELTSLQIKSTGFMVLGKIILAEQQKIIVSHEITTKFCDLAVEWSASGVDDDMREAVALSFPQIPFATLTSCSALNQAKLWASIFMLAQDDEIFLRDIINGKLVDRVGQPCCDRKSLEMLTSCFVNQFLRNNPIEGIILLIALLVREDFEVEAKVADDETEDRLFDKSEMNMYFEHLTLAKTIQSTLESFLKQTPSFKLNLNTVLTENQIKFYLAISNRNNLDFEPEVEVSIRRLLSGEDVPGFPPHPSSFSSILRDVTKNSDNDTVRKLIQGYLRDFSKLLSQA